MPIIDLLYPCVAQWVITRWICKNFIGWVEFIKQAIVNQGILGVQSILKIPPLLLIVFFRYRTM